MKPKVALILVKDSANDWTQDKVPIHAAALSYYTIFSIASLLIIAIAVAALAFGAGASRGEFTQAMQGLVGQSRAHAIEDMIKGAGRQGKGSGIGAYLGKSMFLSSYGAAGSVLILLTWVSYSSLILFFGAEFTRVYADHFGEKIIPAAGAQKAGPTPQQREDKTDFGKEGAENSPWRKATEGLGMAPAQLRTEQASNIFRMDMSANAKRRRRKAGGAPIFSSAAALLIGLGTSVRLKLANRKKNDDQDRSGKAV